MANGELSGWAWHPGDPGAFVEVEQWVNGALVATTLADQFRPDLASIGIGDGKHGWRMPLALDPERAGPQNVELRIRGGGLLKNGALQLSYAPVKSIGVCDGRVGATIYGWAWRPDFPETNAEVELWLDGVLKARAPANLPRSDLGRMGHGRYGWRMNVSLDPDKPGPQLVELRITDGDALAGGRFTLRPEDLQKSEGALDLDAIQGCVDGKSDTGIHGWAWNPLKPNEPVEVQAWINGDLVDSTLAQRFRGDLRANGIGNGRCAWTLPIQTPPPGSDLVRVEIRVKDGAVLTNGSFDLNSDLEAQLESDPAARAFVDAVLIGKRDAAPRQRPLRQFLLYRQPPTSEGPFWSASMDDYLPILNAFRPAFQRLGNTHVIERPSDVVAICENADGQEVILVSFGEPKTTPLDVPCQVLPVFGWGFPTTPTGAWDGDPRSDWRSCFRSTQRAVTLSPFAAKAVKRAMGDQFEVRAIAPPIEGQTASAASSERRTIPTAGALFDSRDHVFDPDALSPPPFVWGQKTEVDVAGVMFTSFMDMEDGRKGFWDLITAFVKANRDHQDAVLVLRLVAPYAKWQQLLYEGLRRLSPFSCRVIAVRGEIDEPVLGAMIDATHWYVSAANAEATCWPMVRFMAAGRPVIAPTHTAFAEFVDDRTGLPVTSHEKPWDWPGDVEYWSWSQHPDDVGPTTAHRPQWTDLVAAYAQAYALARAEGDGYRKLGEGARLRVNAVCSVERAAAELEAFMNQREPSITHRAEFVQGAR